MYFYSVFIYTNLAKIVLKEKIISFIWAKIENHWDLLLPEQAKKKRKKKHKYTTQNFFYENPYCPPNKTSVTT